MTDSTDPLAGVPLTAPAAPTEAGSPLAEIWSQLFPWAALNAKSPPERYLSLGTDIIPTLAVMIAAGGAGPQLLLSDSGGRLQTSSLNLATDTTKATMAPGDNHFTPNNPAIYLPGGYVVIEPVTARPIVQSAFLFQVTDVYGGNVYVLPASPVNFQAGAFVTLVNRPEKYSADFTLSAAGVVVAPLAGATIATLTIPLPGVYEVIVYVGYSSPGDNSGNMQANFNGTAIRRLIGPAGANAASGPIVFPRVNVNVGNGSFTVSAIVAGAAGSIYEATIDATRLAG